jgi:hypothetical protein
VFSSKKCLFFSFTNTVSWIPCHSGAKGREGEEEEQGGMEGGNGRKRGGEREREERERDPLH